VLRRFVRGWILLVESSSKLGLHSEALQQCQMALQHVCSCPQLLRLQTELAASCGDELSAEAPQQASSESSRTSSECSRESKEVRREPRRGRPRSASRLISSLFSSTFGSLSRTSSPSSFCTPVSTPASSSRSDTPMPPNIPRPAHWRSQVDPRETPGRSQPNAPKVRPSSAPAGRRSGAEQAKPTAPRWGARARTVPDSASAADTAASGRVPGPGPPLLPSDPSECCNTWNMKQSASLSSLAASSRLGVSLCARSCRSRTRPSTAGPRCSMSSSSRCYSTSCAWA